MNEEEQEKLYELLFKDTKNKLEETIEEQQNKIESLQKEIKLMKSININDNYISKDKIREKIKELEWVEEVYKCQCDSCRDIRDEGRYMAYKKLLEEEEYE